MKMGFLFTCVIFVAVYAKSGDAIQCYTCTGSMGMGAPTGPNCFDPFNSEGITTAECSGQCFANSTAVSAGPGFMYQQVQRGCTTDPSEDNCPPSPICVDSPAPDGSGSGSYCSYCCSDNLCNSKGLEAAAEGGTSCWNCLLNKTEGMEITPGSCASDDFNGGVLPDVVAVPCAGMCVIADVPAGLIGESAQFLRTCDQFSLCAPGGPPQGFENVEFKCCEGDKCNVGGIDGDEGGEGTEPGGGESGEITTPGEGMESGEITTPNGDSKMTIHSATVFSGLFASIYIKFYLM